MPGTLPVDEFTNHLKAARNLWGDHLRPRINKVMNNLDDNHAKTIKWFVRKDKRMKELSQEDWRRYAEDFRTKKFGYEIYPNELKRGIKMGITGVADDLGVSKEMAEILLSLHINEHGQFFRLVR